MKKDKLIIILYNYKIIIMDNPFKWDGSDLGVINDEHIIAYAYSDHSNELYWQLNINEHITIGIVKRSNNTFPCIIDELKKVFNLPKVGTHRFQYKNIMYIFMKALITSDFHIQEEYTLDQLPFSDIFNDKSFINQIQEIFVFRELLGIVKSYENSIRIRSVSFTNKFNIIKPYPLSFHEPKFCDNTLTKVIPKTILDKWFKNTDISIVARRLINISNPDDIPYILHNIRSQLESIILRVDKNAIWCLTFIMERISSRLSYNLI